jgi:hypothetical protein
VEAGELTVEHSYELANCRAGDFNFRLTGGQIAKLSGNEDAGHGMVLGI